MISGVRIPTHDDDNNNNNSIKQSCVRRGGRKPFNYHAVLNAER